MLSKALQGAAKGVAVDSDFENVTLLLHGNGTNGAQNNTFLDSSSNNFTITRNGNTTQGTFSPYGDNWSNYFNGGSDRISNASASVMDFGTNNFTVEMWVYLTSTADQMFFEGPSNTGFQFFLQSGVLYAGTSAVVTAVSYTLPSGFANSWHHICVVREGTGSNQTSLYVDGVRQSQGTLSTNYTTTGFQISRTSGYLVYGYISNLRVVKGTAVYTGASFTVPSAPLTAITNTSLLTCQSNRFIDNSSNAFALTVAGNTSVQRFSPFSPTAAYASGTIGGSGYFDGTGDYLQSPTNATLALGTGDFCVECWVYITGTNNFHGFFQPTTDNLNVQRTDAGNIEAWDGTTRSTSTPILQRCWNHVAFTRSSSTARLFLNGVQATSWTSSVNYSTNMGFIVGYTGNGSLPLTGYVSDFRVVKGSAVYTSGFTPPTSPLTAITNTQLLLNYTNAGIIDNAMMNDLETVGNAQISTSVSKFGGSSMYFDGNGDYLKSNVGTSDLYTFGTSDFTIEMWLYLTNVSVAQVIFDTRPASTNGVYPDIYFNNSGSSINWYISSADRITSSSVSINTWYHVAVCRSGTSTKMFINGTQSGSTYTDTNNYLCAAQRPIIGVNATDSSSSPFYGYIDDLRVTKGVARYTANFTAPTAPFADQ